jgi:Protein of unknown function (DUF2778)
MFAGQQPYPTWPQALPPPDDSGSGALATEPVGAKANRVSSGVGGSRMLPIVLGLAALASVGFVGTLMLRPAAAPKTAAALPALASAPKAAAALPALVAAPPPLAEDASNAQPIEPEPFSRTEMPPPIQIGVSEQGSLEALPPLATTIVPAPRIGPLPPARDLAGIEESAPLPPRRPLEIAPAPTVTPATGYDRLTAVYDISAHTVYQPDGTRLEAHSGLGGDRDDPRFVDERDRGATPPHLYELTLRESLFHGVQALRLTPIGEGFSFDRVGLLAHPYMLGPNGDSNGCVSFKDYDAFLRAFQSGEVKRLAVVARWTQEPRQIGRLASLQGLDR